MKSRIVLAAILLATISTIGTSQDDTFKKVDRVGDLLDQLEKLKLEAAELDRLHAMGNDVRSLLGVKGVNVSVERLRENATSAGLTEEQLQTDVELKLRLAGIKVNSEEERLASEDEAFLYVRVTTVTADTLPLFAMSVELQFRQNVRLARKPGMFCVGTTTWQTGNISIRGAAVFVEGTRATLRDLSDMFINAYLTANPKE